MNNLNSKPTTSHLETEFQAGGIASNLVRPKPNLFERLRFHYYQWLWKDEPDGKFHPLQRLYLFWEYNETLAAIRVCGLWYVIACRTGLYQSFQRWAHKRGWHYMEQTRIDFYTTQHWCHWCGLRSETRYDYTPLHIMDIPL